jgi:hypothetical protein
MTASSTDGLVSEPGPEVVSPTSNSVFPTPEVSVSSADKLTSQIPVNEPLPFDKAQDLRPTELAKPSYRELWGRFLEKLKIGKRKKLDKVMTLFVKKSKDENEDVQKLLRVSDATAERYLNILEKESKVRQVGKTGKYTYYEKI